MPQLFGATPVTSLTRERSFIRTPNQQKQQNKRRSIAFNPQHEIQQHQLRIKPAIELYRPPSMYHPDSLRHVNISTTYSSRVLNKCMDRTLDICVQCVPILALIGILQPFEHFGSKSSRP